MDEQPTDDLPLRLEVSSEPEMRPSEGGGGRGVGSQARSFLPFAAPLKLSTACLVVIAVSVLMHSLFLARTFFVPLTVALMLQFVLSPIVRRLAKWRISPSVGSAMVLLAVITAGVFSARVLVRSWPDMSAELPRLVDRLEELLAPVREGAQVVQEAAEDVQELTNEGRPGTKESVVVTQAPPGLLQIASSLGAFLSSVVFSIFMLYFLLASYDSLILKIVEVLPSLGDKKAFVHGARSIESTVSRYLLTITLVNVTLGLVVGSAMYLLGMPSPQLWGLYACLANFVPYVGALSGIVLVGAAATLEFEEPLRILVIPLAYGSITTLEGMLVTPSILGRSFRMSPVAIFAWLSFWSWMWGIPGALVAVPLLVILKVLMGHIPVTRPLAKLLG